MSDGRPAEKPCFSKKCRSGCNFYPWVASALLISSIITATRMQRFTVTQNTGPRAAFAFAKQKG